MKIFLVTLFLAFSSLVYCQVYSGTYTNSVGQELVISDVNDDSFSFTVTWGEDDEWGCIFDADGTAKFEHKAYAYFGDDAEWPEVGFTINSDGAILLEPSSEWVGMDCARYGETSFEKFTLFTMEE